MNAKEMSPSSHLDDARQVDEREVGLAGPHDLNGDRLVDDVAVLAGEVVLHRAEDLLEVLALRQLAGLVAGLLRRKRGRIVCDDKIRLSPHPANRVGKYEERK
jgi:hypothetical protein